MRQSKGRASASRAERKSTERAGATPQAPIPPPPNPEPLSPAPAGTASALADNTYCVSLPAFEGPLDLLLHLIQQHELDIFDIPVSFITEKYLEYLQMMRSLSIDIASEYLVMAATLAHIKSKMLLPTVPKGQEDDGLPEDEEDPRAELVRRLLEYQKYRAAAMDLAERGTLGRDVFGRGISEPVAQGPAPFAPLGVFSLLSAFEQILKRRHIRIDHEVVFDRISITDRIVEITERLMERKSMRFDDLLFDGEQDAAPSRFEVVITFLAILEMCRLRVIRVYQSDPLAPLHLELAVQQEASIGQDNPTRPAGIEAPSAPMQAGPPIAVQQSTPAAPIEQEPLPAALEDGVSHDSPSAGDGVDEVDHGG